MDRAEQPHGSRSGFVVVRVQIPGSTRQFITTPRWRERSALVRAWRYIATSRPITFRDKVRYKMLRDHRPLIVTYADKAAVRDYVASLIGEHYLPLSFIITEEPGDLVGRPLPDSFVMKPTHGSGAVVVVSAVAPTTAQLPPSQSSWMYSHVRPSTADREQLADIARSWLSQLYGQGPNREWAYTQIVPRIIVEELLVGPDGMIPDDYKFFVFHGRVHYIQVDSGRFGERTQDFYSADWEHLTLSGGPPWSAEPRGVPERLAEMIDVAERLAVNTDFVRVDLYQLNDRVVFGELTSYPAGGDSPFIPDTWNTTFGLPWNVPKKYL
jgi:hypothetical protein